MSQLDNKLQIDKAWAEGTQIFAVLAPDAKQQLKYLMTELILSADRKPDDSATINELAELKGRKDTIIELLRTVKEL